MKRSINFFILGMYCVTLVTLHSCKLHNIDPETVDLGYDYYPLEIGRYIIYDEHDIIYNSLTTVDTSYNVKEVIQDSYTEGNEKIFLVYHYAKQRSDTEWPLQPDSVWTVVNTGNQLIRSESNYDFIKLVFPVKEGKTWNGNAKNTEGETTSSDKYYKMTNLNQPYTATNSVTYEKTLKMTIANQSDPIVSTDIRYDIYARGIGLIKKDYLTYYYKQDGSSQTIDFGSHKVMEITSYGKE